MPPRKQTRVTQANPASYQSSACRIGTHQKCVHASPLPPELGLPIVYEACGCPCHGTSRKATR
jgi:hypothetical protein